MLNQFNDEKNRKYNSVKGTNDAVTLEDIEAYRLTQRRFEDPMNNNNSNKFWINELMLFYKINF